MRVGLVGHVLQHACDLAVLDLEEQYTAELEVVALLVDRERTVFHDIDTFSTLDISCSGVSCSLPGCSDTLAMRWNCTSAPALRIAATVRFLLSNDVHLVADGLVVDQRAVFYQVPRLALHTFVVITHCAQGTGL